MLMRGLKIALLLLFIGIAVPARADIIYSYVGDTALNAHGVYEPGVDSISGYLALAESFTGVPYNDGLTNILANISSQVIYFSFTDGHQTLTEQNSTAVFRISFAGDGSLVVP